MVTPKQANADITSIKKRRERRRKGEREGDGERVQNEYFKKKGVKSFVTGQMKTMERSEREGRTGGDDVNNNNQEDREPRQSKD